MRMGMVITIDKMSPVPIYQQLRNGVVAAIASGELRPGAQLPSVRTLGRDLGINLHTVNKAYAILRDEGYVLMRGRAGAVVAEPLQPGDDSTGSAASPRAARADKRLADGLMLLALEHKASGGTRAAFEGAVARVLDAAYRATEPATTDPSDGDTAASAAPA